MKVDSMETATERAMRLPTNGLARVHGFARLRVLRGMLWLTIDGEPDDHMLMPGDRFTLDRGANALVQALSAPASLVIAEAAPSWPRRAGAVLRAATQRFVEALA